MLCAQDGAECATGPKGPLALHRHALAPVLAEIDRMFVQNPWGVWPVLMLLAVSIG